MKSVVFSLKPEANNSFYFFIRVGFKIKSPFFCLIYFSLHLYFVWKKIALKPLPSSRQKAPSLFHILLILGLMAAFFALDLCLPLGMAGGVPYVAVVLVVWWLGPGRYIIPMAMASSILVGLGYLFSPDGGIPWVVFTNRMLALFAIWVTAFSLVRANRSGCGTVL